MPNPLLKRSPTVVACLARTLGVAQSSVESSKTEKPSSITWVPRRLQPKRNFYPCHIDNKPFQEALQAFTARSHRFEATIGRPRAGRDFMLKLSCGRYVTVTNYDDFPYSLEFSLEIDDADGYNKPTVHMADLKQVLDPLGLTLPDRSNDGFLSWLPDA